MTRVNGDSGRTVYCFYVLALKNTRIAPQSLDSRGGFGREVGEEGGHGPVLPAASEGRQQTFRQVLGRKESGGEGRENKEEVLFDLFTLLVDGIEIYGGI